MQLFLKIFKILTGMANSEDPDQTAPDLGLHCLHIFSDTLVYEILGHLPYSNFGTSMKGEGVQIPMVTTVIEAGTQQQQNLQCVLIDKPFCYCAFDILQKVVFCLALYTEEVNMQTFCHDLM